MEGITGFLGSTRAATRRSIEKGQGPQWAEPGVVGDEDRHQPFVLGPLFQWEDPAAAPRGGRIGADFRGGQRPPAVLHEIAEDARQRRSALSPSDGATDPRADVPEVEPASLKDARPPLVRRGVVLAVAALAGVGAGMVISSAWNGDRSAGNQVKTTAAAPGPSSSRTSATAERKRYVFQPGKSYPCEVRRSEAAGKGPYAGYSVTQSAVLAGPGWDVVEAQCLLRHHHMEPGIVDGVYGQQTIAAVMRLQGKAGLPADGVVGPHTWRVLRG